MSVTIHVIDENDNAPKFSNETFSFYMAENETPDSYVGRLTATDRDVRRNAELTFSIPASTSQAEFSVDPKSGFIKTTRYFDRERLLQTTGQDYVVLEAVVSDNGVVRLRDRARIHVHILDVNDNAPVFSRLPYRAQVSEGASVETLVFRVVTTDVDDQLNGGIFYYISEGNGDHKFRIDESSGQIILNRPLDRERTSRCTLTVGARVDGSDRRAVRERQPAQVYAQRSQIVDRGNAGRRPGRQQRNRLHLRDGQHARHVPHRPADGRLVPGKSSWTTRCDGRSAC